MRILLRLWPLTFLLAVFMSACTSTKHIAYFQDIGDSINVVKEPIQSIPVAPEIEPDDILLIEVGSPVPGAAAIYNQGTSSRSSGLDRYIGASSTASSLYNRAAQMNLGYLVDSSGNINFSVFGTIHLSRLIIVEAAHTKERGLQEN